ncbi:MAG: DinB family protein [Ilumatobacteraceae bacterium]
MTIEPENKNWTWVLERPCPECGFDTQSFPSTDLARLVRDAGKPWRELLAHPLVRVRPADDRWSALEYGCHVRDVFQLGVSRANRMLLEDNPSFANWDQDETAVAEHYELQDPLTVADDLSAASTALADIYETVSGKQWDRPGTRSDGSPFTVETFGRYFLHDPVHHVVDVQKGLALLQGPP